MLHPEYIGKRVADLPPKFGLRVLLVLVDTVRFILSRFPYLHAAIDLRVFLSGTTWRLNLAAQQVCY